MHYPILLTKIQLILFIMVILLLVYLDILLFHYSHFAIKILPSLYLSHTILPNL